MEFIRDRVLNRTSTGAGTTAVTVVYPEITSLNLTNASAADGSTVAVPTAYNKEATFEVDLNGHGQLFTTLHVNNLGTAGSIYVLMEFQHPDNPLIWIPSMEGVARTVVAIAAYENQAAAVGDYIFATRIEPLHFTKARVRFRANAAPSANTDVDAYWFYGGLPSGLYAR